MKKTLLVALVCAAVVPSFAVIVNASFEDPHLNNGSFNTSGINGWSTNGVAGVWNIPTSSFFLAEAPDGTQIGYSNGSSIAQQTSSVLNVGLTTLTCMGGRRHDSLAGSFKLQLWAGGSVANGNVTGGTMLSETLYDHTTQAIDSFALVTVNYTSTANDANLGKNLTVRLLQTASNQMDFDDVRLNTVPEPATFVAIGIGGLLLIAKRRR